MSDHQWSQSGYMTEVPPLGSGKAQPCLVCGVTRVAYTNRRYGTDFFPDASLRYKDGTASAPPCTPPTPPVLDAPRTPDRTANPARVDTTTAHAVYFLQWVDTARLVACGPRV